MALTPEEQAAREQRKLEAESRGIVFEDLENQRTTEAGGLPVWGEDTRPIEKKTLRKPDKPKKFIDRFKSALDNEKFQAWKPEMQKAYVNKIFDEDEGISHFNPEQRSLYLNKTSEVLRREWEHNTSVAGQIEDTLGHKLSPGVEMMVDDFEAIPGAGPALGLSRSALKSMGASLASIGTKAQFLLDQEIGEFVPTGNEEMDKKRRAKYDALSTRKTADFMQESVDSFEQVLALMENDKELGQAVMDMAERAPTKASRATLDSFIRSSGPFEPLVQATGLTANTLADSFGIMLSALAAGGSPRAVLAGMQFVHSGLQQDAAKSAGVELDPGAQEISGLVQASLGMAAGPEAYLVGKSGSAMIEALMKSGFKRAFSRVATGMGVEGATEFTQEYINQQLPEWSKDNKGFWNNLDDDQKKEVIQGAILAPFATGPIEAMQAGVKGQAEKRAGERGQEFERRMALLDLSPEERGAKKQLTITPDQELSPEAEQELKFRMMPEFLKKEVEEGNLDRAQEFVEGTFVPAEGEQEATQEAEAAIAEAIEGPKPQPVEIEGRKFDQVLEAIAGHARKTADNLGGKQGEDIRLGADTLHFVEPTEDARHDWMRELQGYADSTGQTLVFYDSDGQPVSGGIVVNEGVIAVRYNDQGATQAVADVFLHELTHGFGKRSPAIHRALMDVVKETFPEQWAAAQEKLLKIDEQRGTPIPDAIRDSEALGHFTQDNAPAIFRAVAEIARNPEKANTRGGRSLIEKFAEWVRRIVEKMPSLKNVLPVIPTDKVERNEAIAKIADHFYQAMEGTKVGERPEKVTKPTKRPTVSKSTDIVGQEEIPTVSMVTPGDNIAIARGIGGTVATVEREGDMVKMTMVDGEVHILPPGQGLRGLVEGSLTPPKAEAPKETEKPAAAAEPPKTEEPAPKEAAPEQTAFEFSDTYWHFSGVDATKTDLKREFAGTGAAGREAARFEKVEGKLDPESAAIHLYLPGKKPEPKVVAQSKFLNEIRAEMNLIKIGSREARKLAQQLAEQGLAGEDHIKAFIKEIKSRGYDGLVDTDRGMVQLYKDIPSEVVANSKELTQEEKLTFTLKRLSDRAALPEKWEWDQASNEEVVNEIEAAGLMSDMVVKIENTDGTNWSGTIEKDGDYIADVVIRVQFQGTEDETVFFDWIGMRVATVGDEVNGLGVRGVLSLRDQLQEIFPGAKFVAGLRVGGTHALARNSDHDAMIRVPIHTPAQRTRRGIVLPPERTQSELMMIYGFDAYYSGGEADVTADDRIDMYEEMTRDSGADVALQEGYDDNPDVIFDELDDNEELIELVRAQTKAEVDDVFNSEVLLHPDDSIETWGEKEWKRFGKEQGIENIGGISPMVKVGKVEVPGGTEGTWTYQELLAMKAAAIDPDEAWTEEEHVEIQKKLARTLTPEPGDTMQALNNFTFALLSNGLNLTVNEIAYANVRIQNDEEVAEWAARVPWNATEGEVPSREVYERMEEPEQREFQEWLKDWKKIKTPVDKIEDRSIGSLMKEFYDRRIQREFGMGTLGEGGLGLGRMKYHLTDVAALAQFYQVDPEYLMKGDTESWYHYSNRMASQFSGMSFKIAIFGAVWQDPMYAAVSAIDRHMAVILRDEIFTDPIKRKNFEDAVAREWTKKRSYPGYMTIDEIMQEKGGTAFIGEMLLTKISKPMMRKYDLNKHDFKFISDPEKVALMSREYKNALKENIREGKRLGLGVFATQHLLWDRQRRRFEPHASQFPGLYKAPKMTQPRLKKVLQKAKDLGHTGTRHEMVEKDGRRESRLKRPRSAPPGDLAFLSEAPSAFERGSTRHQIANLNDIQPLNQLNPDDQPLWVIPDESWMGWIKRKIQDKFFRVAQLQDAVKTFTGASIRDEMDVYLHEMLYHGRAADQVERFEKDYVKPLMDTIRDQNINLEAFEEWLHAKHAEERNSHLQEAWYDRRKQALQDDIAATESDIAYLQDQGGEATTLKRRLRKRRKELRDLETASVPDSGMTTDRANEIIAEAGDTYDEVGALFRSMMDQKLEIMIAGGIISQQQADTVNNAYANYVPLKGKKYDGDLEVLLDDAGAGTGRGFDIRGDELGFAFGRKEGDRHTHPILSQAIVDIEEAIVRSEKNEVGKAFLAFVEEFPNEDIYEVNKRVKRRVWDKETGTIKLVDDSLAKRSEEVLAVKRDGETFFITVKDARLISALKNIGTGNHGWPVRILAAANRLMAKINTTLNPEFMVSNFARDIQAAMVHLNDKDAQGIAMETLGNLPSAMRGIAGSEFLNANESEWQQAYDDFKKHGGKIGFFGYNDVISKARALQRMVRRHGPGAGNWSYRRMVALGNLVEAGNTVVENGIRLAAYKTAVDNGMSPKRAAALARRLTVNFNKKGEVGSFINAMWLFSNASIQGTARMIQALKSSRRVRGMASSMFVMSFIQSLLARGMGGDDEEDGYSYWEKLPDWQKETNTIIMIPGGKGDHIKIPLPYGYNIFNVLGTQAADLAYNAWTGKSKASDVPKAGLEVFNAMLGAFNPLGSTRIDSGWGMARFATPSVFAPIMDTLVNETYYGAPIQPTRSSWDTAPDSHRYFRGVSRTSQKLSAWANEMSGGNAYQPGVIDVNPEVLDYLVGAYSGAGPKTGKRILFDGGKWLWNASRGDITKPEANDVAFLRRVYGEENDHTVASMFYEHVQEIEQAEAAWNNLKDDPNFDSRAWRRRHGWKTKVFKDLSSAQKRIKKADDPDEKNKIRKQFNRAYRIAWEKQF